MVLIGTQIVATHIFYGRLPALHGAGLPKRLVNIGSRLRVLTQHPRCSSHQHLMARKDLSQAYQ